MTASLRSLLRSLLLALPLAVGAGLVCPTPAIAKTKKKRRLAKNTLRLRHLHTKQKLTLKVLSSDPKRPALKRVRKQAHRQLRRFVQDWGHKKSKPVPERLIWYLYLIGQHFDAPLEIVSGYRCHDRKTSRHYKGYAIDFRVRGVGAKQVWQYAKRFGKIGLGWYPTTHFVHLDVRKQSYYWIDDSGTGEAAEYRSAVPQEWRRWLKKKKIASR